MRPRLALSSLLVLLAVAGAAPAEAAAEPRITATPNPIPFGKTLIVQGRGWPVIEFCSRTVRLSLRSDQNAVRIGTDRVGTRGRFRFTWVPRRREVGRGDWTLVARMRCESGEDGSPNPVRATAPLRTGGSRLVVGRGRTSTARWALYARRARSGAWCDALGIRGLGEPLGLIGEGCGEGVGGRAVTLAVTTSRDHGTFAYGQARLDVGRVEATFGSTPPMEARILPSPPVLGFRGRFWIAPFEEECEVVSVRAFDGEGRLLIEVQRIGGRC